MYFTERDDNASNVPRNNIPFLIGVSGGTGSGKSTLCQRIMAKLGQEDEKHLNRGVVCISQDSFYRDLTSAEKLQAGKGEFNFDHPDAFNKELMKQTLLEILSGKVVKIPKYDYKSHTLLKNEMITINPSDVVIFEGILIFHFPEIRELFHMKLFVDTLSDTRLTRRVQKDVNERGRKLEEVLNQYLSFVKPAFDDFCFPSKKFANVVIPGGGDNLVVINLIVRYILHIIKEPGEKNFDDINYDKICENKSGKKCEERYR